MALIRASRFILTAILSVLIAATGYVELICTAAIGAPGVFLLMATAWLVGFLTCGLAKLNVHILGVALVLPLAISGLAMAGAAAGDAAKLLATAAVAYGCAVAGWIIGRNVAAKRERND